MFDFFNDIMSGQSKVKVYCMKKVKQKLSALALCTVFAAMQAGTFANPIDTGLGGGNGGAVINNVTGGFVGGNAGNNSFDLNFNGNAHVNWDSLNVNKGENLNFNAVNGANDLTILNTVNHGMSNIYGQINANSGIGKLIISNPNGMLFDGAKFTTAGDLMLTTKDLSNLKVEDLSNFDINNAQFTKLYNEGKLIPIKIVNNSEFNVGGDYSIVAAGIDAANSAITAKSVKFVTANGQDFIALKETAPTKDQTVTRMKAMNINGDLYVTNDVGAFELLDGGSINGNTKVLTSGNVIVNKENNDNKLTITGDVDIKGNGAQMYLRNADVNGNLRMANGGGFLDVGDIHVTKDANLITRDVSTNNFNCAPVKHFVHVIGDTKVDGNLTVDAKDNIHIGGYDYDNLKLADGSLTVGGDLVAHSVDGHVMTTIDTAANKISLKSDNLNVLTDGKAKLSANEYEFSANGYIGGLTSTDAMGVDEKVVNIMENYIHIPDTVGTPGNINIAGGTISKIETPKNASAYIASSGDVKLTGANAGKINITAPDKYIEITGNDVHADTITVGKETDKLKVDFPSRDYTLKYTNIRDAKEVTVNGNEEITYELTNGKNGYNISENRQDDTTYLVGPNEPIIPTPDPEPDPLPVPDDNENVKVLRSYERYPAVDQAQPYTPVAYAADLDDDKDNPGIRKNVDGSVTVVKAFPMIN